MKIRQVGIITLLFGLSAVSIELFLAAIFKFLIVDSGGAITMPALLFTTFPVNIGFLISLGLILAGAILCCSKK